MGESERAAYVHVLRTLGDVVSSRFFALHQESGGHGQLDRLRPAAPRLPIYPTPERTAAEASSRWCDIVDRLRRARIIPVDREAKGKRLLQRDRSISPSPSAMAWRESYLDVVLIPLAVLFPAVYHVWLWRAVRRSPLSSTVGISAAARRLWVFSMMKVY